MKIGKLHINIASRTAFVLALFAIGLLSSCKSTRRLGPQEYLVKRNRIEYADIKFDKEAVRQHIRQQPNRKTLLIWSMHLRLYNSGLGKNQDRKFKTWLRKIGEPPIILDSNETERSRNLISQFLFQNGYFNATVRDTIEKNHEQKRPGTLGLHHIFNTFRNRKKVVVTYTADLGQPYIVTDLTYELADTTLEGAFYAMDFKELPEIKGRRYNYKLLDEHRKIITTHFQNLGYFDFKKNYIKYQIDTIGGNHEVRIKAKILDPVRTDAKGNSEKLVHTRYFIDQVYVFPNHKLFQENRYSDTLQTRGVDLIYNKPLKINPSLLPTKIFINKGDFYQIQHVTNTYQNISGMGIHKSINIDFSYKQPNSNNPTEKLDAFIYLSPLKRHAITFETRAETRAYTGQGDEDISVTNFNFGVTGNVSFSRINAFKNGESLKISLTGGLEPFFLDVNSSSKNFFNTVEFGPSVQLTFPRFLLPVKQTRFAKSNNPKTTLSATYNLLQNDDFSRRATKTTIAYSWLETKEKLHRFAPLELSFVDADLSTDLRFQLASLNNPFLTNTYSDQVIVASSYTYTYRKPAIKKLSTGWYNRAKLEGAGNTLRMLAATINSDHEKQDAYRVFGVRFAQYVSLENDLRYYRNNKFGQTLALRLYTAAARPLENLDALPFEKSYFAGGSNGIRAWRARSLGPGSYLDTNFTAGFLNRIGEIRLEGNAEYRFNIISFLEGALFLDAGNIWVFKENGDRKGTEFSKDFVNDLALGGGVGLRLDFDFFIIRFDLGFPLRDPSLPENEKWFFQDKDRYNTIVARFNERNGLVGEDVIPRYREIPNFNIGIGYPF